MKNFLLASSALITIAGAQAARAADVSPAPQLPAKAPAVTAAIYNWTGCYIGAHGGGGAINDTFVAGGNLTNGNFLHGGGGFAGGQIGCNYQDGIMVLGLEGEGWSGLSNSDHVTEGVETLNTIDRNRWGADVAVRTGLAFDRALVYGKAGIAEGRFAFSFTDGLGDFQNGAGTLTGTLLGVGLEYGFAPNWSAKLEYDHIEYAGKTIHLDANREVLLASQSASADLVKAGINYRFGGAAPPLAPDGAPAPIYKALPFKAPTPAAFSRLSSWTGCYAGVHGGSGWMHDSFSTFGSFEIGGGGGFAGGQVGCNVQAGAIVWGIEGEAALSGLTDHNTFNVGSNEDATTRNRWSADVAARGGIAVDRALLYGKAGLAAGRFAFSFTDGPDVINGGTTLAGLLLGAGIEYAVAPNWSVKLEYNRVDYFGRNVAFSDTLEGPELENQAATANVLKLGVNYRFADLPFAPAADRAATGAAILKAPVYKAPVAASTSTGTSTGTWTGCYIGAHGGGGGGVLGDTFTGVGDSDADPVPKSSGGFAGGQIGCEEVRRPARRPEPFKARPRRPTSSMP
ncbi:MAG: outer membrane beta-barrel protein [Xanthobacteraceae bacterium]